VQLLAAIADDDARGLRHLSPRSTQVPERLGHHEPGVVGELVQDRVVGILGAKRGDLSAVRQRSCRRPVSSMRPTARATAFGGSSASPNVRTRKKKSSESVDPSIAG
jgi:hypothetical protein